MTRDARQRSSWTQARLGDVATFVNGRAFKPSDWSKTGTPIIRIQNLNGGGEFNFYSGAVDARFAVASGDLLFSWSGTRGTSFGPHFWRGSDAILNQHIFNLRELRGVHQTFLFYALKSLTASIEKRAHGGTGIVHVTKGELESFTVLLPPLGEQRKIAAILSSVDDAIEATQAVIEQLQVVKKAMMAELLTRGLPGRHTRFKQTELGEVPEDWTVVMLGDVLESIDAGWSPQCETRPAASGEWGVLKVSAVTSGVFRESEQKALPASLEARPNTEVRQGDVLLARANGVLELVGRTVFVRSIRPRLMLSDKLMRLRPITARLDSEYLSLVMGTDVVRSRLLSTTGGSHMRNVSQANLRVLRLPLPPLDEQVRVASTIAATDERIRIEQGQLASLRILKLALMSVLLTGEVRVRPDEDAA